MSAQPQRRTRQYLRHEERRRDLLENASRIIERDGFPALTMRSLANEVGISRQLVYQHFPSLDELLVAVGRYLFEPIYEATREALEKHSDDVMQAAWRARQINRGIPAGQAHALWQILSGAEQSSEKCRRLGILMRDMIIDLWRPVVERVTGLPTQQARVVAWIVIVSDWVSRHLEDDGRVDPNEGLAAEIWFFSRVVGVEAPR